MENQRLLKKYKIKLSLFFAVFVMFSLYLIETIFLVWLFVKNNLDIKENLSNKLFGIENILKNKELYYDQIISNDTTLQKIIIKSLENSQIYEENIKKLDFFPFVYNYNSDLKDWIHNNNWKKFLISSINIENINYKIIIYSENPFNFQFLIKQLIIYFFVLLPFSIFFYGIWYFLTGRNFRVIEQSIQSLEDFTAQVNHEMKTPLSEMISTLELSKKVKNYEESIDITLNSAYKLNKILDSITWIAHLSDISYKKEKIDIWKEIIELTKEFKNNLEEKNINLVLNISKKPYILKINNEHLWLCVRNILSNAIKYSNKNSEINISFENWKLEIKDYWIWIDKNNLKNIFQRYFRENYTSQEWFGLWLALVKKICDINKWKLEVESEKNSFTIISINFI